MSRGSPPAGDAGRAFDARTTPARPDLAAVHLAGLVSAARFVEGRAMRVVASAAPLRGEPRPDALLQTEALRGEGVTVYEDREGWAWAQLDHDETVGYLPSEALREGRERATHRVAALRSFLFPGPDIKLPPQDALPFGSRLDVLAQEGDFAVVEGGFVWARHLVAVGATESDPVAVAERFLGAPYLWGGRTAAGIDCSGLVQLALDAAGLVGCPRDSDQQEAALGHGVDAGEDPLRRGDLVFWRGHVGLMRDRRTLLHANGSAMAVVSEPLATAQRRIAAAGGAVTSIRRIGPARPQASAAIRSELVGRDCLPCRGGVAPLGSAEAERLRVGTPDWSIADAGTRLVRRFTLKTYKQAFDLVERISALAETQGHHPDIGFGWGYCDVSLETYAIGGLHMNDFVLAAKIDALTTSA